DELRYAWRLDDGNWSAYTMATIYTFLELSDGDHTLEVRARDRDFNVDPTPAVVHFTVVPPVWKQAWFLALVGSLLAAIAVQTSRVMRRERRLTAHNQQLTLERGAERIRAEAQAMQSAHDLHLVVGVVHKLLLEFGFEDSSVTLIFHHDEDDPDRLHAYAALANPHRRGRTWSSPRIIELDEHTVAFAHIYDYSDRPERLVQILTEDVSHSQGDTSDLTQSMREIFADVGYDDLEAEAQWLARHQSHYTGVRFANGNIASRGTRHLDTREIDILRAFGDALSLGLLRFADFQRLEQASTNKSQFLRRMSHDLRSPMNAIIGYSRLLRRRTADRLDEREQRNLANIETSSGNLLNLINDILDLSRIEAGRIEVDLQAMDPRVLANECADALESIVNENVALHRELDDVGVISSDPDRLRQVVMNLLGNATKFTEAGSITLSLKRVSGVMPSTGSSTAGPVDDEDAEGSDHYIELSVADTGIGIPAEDLPHIFDEFRQVERQGGEQEGTGLGLAIASKTVDLLGGEITATSEVGKGTTFTVILATGESS
ncbi:MAG: hypothetical protein HN783_03855, partial [Ilumatobacter sp.]|nr:hypothetical protein [Ilumatobacter sp.]